MYEFKNGGRMKKTRKLLHPARLYYLRDTRTVVGNCLLWWRKGNSGYTCDLDDAAVFTEEDARAHYIFRNSDRPYPKDLIDTLAVRHVDHQVTDHLEFSDETVEEVPQTQAERKELRKVVVDGRAWNAPDDPPEENTWVLGVVFSTAPMFRGCSGIIMQVQYSGENGWSDWWDDLDTDCNLKVRGWLPLSVLPAAG